MLSAFATAWREVKAIVLGLGAVLALGIWLRSPWLTLFAALLLGWVFYFFRNPERVPDSTAAGAILAPADGRITAVERLEEPTFAGQPSWRISIFLSLFDVHVQRSPCAGIVRLLRYRPGSFVPANSSQAHLNESNFIGLRTPYGRVGVVQFAGILARRIVCWVSLGDKLAPGQRLGMIRFGSRVDLLLPIEAEVLVQVGQQVYGGQTLVARWPVPD